MKVFTLAKLIITIPLCLDVDSLPDAICSVCDCQPNFGVFCRGEEISGLMSDETLHLGMDFPIIDLRSSEGLRKGMVHCETVFGSTKILLSGSGVRCGELLTYSSLTYCDHEVCSVFFVLGNVFFSLERIHVHFAIDSHSTSCTFRCE